MCAQRRLKISLGSLIRVLAVRMKKHWVLSYPLSVQRRLIRLGGCPGLSESSLGAQSFCWFCHEAARYQGDSPSPTLIVTLLPSTVGAIMPFDRLALHTVPLSTWYVSTSENIIMRLWHFSSSVNSFFKRARTVGLDTEFLIGPFVYFHTSCAGLPELSLVAYVISTIRPKKKKKKKMCVFQISAL